MIKAKKISEDDFEVTIEGNLQEISAELVGIIDGFLKDKIAMAALVQIMTATATCIAKNIDKSEYGDAERKEFMSLCAEELGELFAVAKLKSILEADDSESNTVPDTSHMA